MKDNICFPLEILRILLDILILTDLDLLYIIHAGATVVLNASSLSNDF